MHKVSEWEDNLVYHLPENLDTRNIALSPLTPSLLYSIYMYSASSAFMHEIFNVTPNFITGPLISALDLPKHVVSK